MLSPALLPLNEIAARLTAATIAGAILGINRNLNGKAAGLRTHALVALGAALVTAAAATVDPGGATRVMQGVITGIGFIGAGLILHPRAPTGGAPTVAVSVSAVASPTTAAPASTASKRPSRARAPRHRRREVRGLTTAANVWVAAGLGLASGLGAWAIVLVGTVLTLAILVGGGRVEDGVRRRLLARLRRRRAALQHHHRAGHEIRVRERDVHPHDA